MVKNICVYPNHRLLGEIQAQPFEQNGRQVNRVSFAISSYAPDSQGFFLKLYCYAFDAVADELLRANLKDGDILTIICEHRLFKTKSGVVESRYNVTSFSYLKQQNNSNNSAPQEAENKGNINEYMNVLSSIFGG